MALGVTGHRTARFDPGQVAAIDGVIARVVTAIAASLVRHQAGTADWFAPDPPLLRVLSSLSDGADRLVAERAMAAGFALQAVLPFDPEIYAADFAETRAEFDALLSRATAVLTLPGDRADATAAYAMASEALVAHSTVLLAVWDGAPALGQGGTADVVAGAVAAGVPVIHVPLDPDAPVRLLWSSFEPLPVAASDIAQVPAREWSPDALDAMLAQLLLPPADPHERAYLRRFYAERERRWHFRAGYPLLQAVATGRRPQRGIWRRRPYRETTRADWAGFHAACGQLCAPNLPAFEPLEAAYSWADNLAAHFARNVRSGHVLNFVFVALASCVAIAGLKVEIGFKPWMVLAELLLVLAIVVNTTLGHRQAWQRRWLDYRIIAERLRPMRSLKLLGIATPPRAPARKRKLSQRWVDWYVAAQWRQMGVPQATLDPACRAELLRLAAEHELGPEIAYHRRNAGEMERINALLHRIGNGAFYAVILVCIGYLAYSIGTGAPPTPPAWAAVAFVFLPVIGAATYGLRMNGDFSGNAARSIETAVELEAIQDEFCGGTIPLGRAARLMEAAARIMVVDLAEWRLTYEQRDLELPG